MNAAAHERMRHWLLDDPENRCLVVDVEGPGWHVTLWQGDDSYRPGRGQTIDEAIAAALEAEALSLKVSKVDRMAREAAERIGYRVPFFSVDVERFPETDAFAKWLIAEAMAGSERDIVREAIRRAKEVPSYEGLRPAFMGFLADDVRRRVHRYWRAVTLRIAQEIERAAIERGGDEAERKEP